MRPALLALLGLLLLPGCAGQSDLERCVQHSVQEGVRESAAQAACEQVVRPSGAPTGGG